MKQTILLLFLLPLLGFKFNPMSQSIELGDGKKSAQFMAENETTESMAIEFAMKERKLEPDGKEDLPETKLVTIFPPQVIIPPKEKRTIRVNWVGPKDITEEKSFRVIAEQLPLDVGAKKKRQTGIQMLMRYMAALYVSPSDIESKLQSKIEASSPKELSVRVTNSGSKHQILINPVLTLKKGSEKWVLKDKQLQGLAGENVLANSHRIFKLKADRSFPADAEVILKVED